MDDALPGAAPAPAPEPGPAGAVPCVVTLIHGTWAFKAPWIRPHSGFSTALRARLPDGSRIFPFVWSGKNNNMARRLASERLLNKLARRVDKYPAARHYVIGHSHGGNVILHTLARAPFRRRIAGVACLSTPFLVARPRDLGRDPWKHIVGAVIGPLLLATWIGVRALSATWWIGLLEFTALVLLLALATGVATIVLRRWRDFVGKLLRDLQSPGFDAKRMLIIRSPGDEASGGLDFLQLITRVTVGLWVRTMSLYERLEAAAGRAVKQKKKLVALAALTGLVYIGFIALVTFKNWLTPLAFAGIIALAVVLLEAIFLAFGWAERATLPFLLLASAVIWPVIVLLSILLLGFGWEVALANILLDVTAETTPAGSWRVHLLDPPTSEELGHDVLPLMHSVVYENPQALELLGEWIASTAVTARPPSPFLDSQ